MNSMSGCMVVLLAAALLLQVGCDGDGPSEIPFEDLTPGAPQKLPEVWSQVRGGHWIHGVNMAWDNYGTDFGESPWGYMGVAGQGPYGWMRKTSADSQGAARLFLARREGADNCLGVEVGLRQDDRHAKAIVYFDLSSPAGKAPEAVVNVSGKTVSCEVYFPAGSEGSPSAPNGAVLFLQDAEWNWFQSDWWNIEAGQWRTLSFRADSASGFDASKVRSVGVMMAVNSRAGDNYRYDGKFYVDNVTASTSSDIKFGFDEPETRTETEMADLSGLQVKALRWWVFCDGRSGILYNDDGSVRGLDDKVLQDFDELIRMCRAHHVYVIPVLFDFLLGAEPQKQAPGVTGEPVTIFGRADLINDAGKRRSLLQNAVLPLFRTYGEEPEIIAWDLMNEPEWLLQMDIPGGKRPKEIQPGGAVTLDTMTQFFSEIVALYRANTQGRQLFTVGSASPRWAGLWVDAGIDLAQFHLWNGPGQLDEGLALDFAPPVPGIPNIVGEFSVVTQVSRHDVYWYLTRTRGLGYSGAWPWSYRSKDYGSLPRLGQQARDGIKRFAGENPDIVNF